MAAGQVICRDQQRALEYAQQHPDFAPDPAFQCWPLAPLAQVFELRDVTPNVRGRRMIAVQVVQPNFEPFLGYAFVAISKPPQPTGKPVSTPAPAVANGASQNPASPPRASPSPASPPMASALATNATSQPAATMPLAAPESPAIRGTLIPLQFEGGTFHVPVSINNALTLNFVLDSGAADVSIPADVVLTLMRTGTIRPADFLGDKTYTLADGSTLPSVTFRIKSLRIGDKVVENVTGSLAPIKGGLLLGQSFLKRFKSWSIDNQRQVLVLE